MAKGQGKGASFERQICRELSLWWTYGKRDDVFWRTQQSGGRATTRAKSKKMTYGQSGDIQAVDPIGEALVKLMCFELKRGYPSATFADLLEIDNGGQYGKWIAQALKSTILGLCHYPVLITKRNMREAMICMPQELYLKLLGECLDLTGGSPHIAVLRYSQCSIYPMWTIMRLERFLQDFTPKWICKVLKVLEKENEEDVANGIGKYSGRN